MNCVLKQFAICFGVLVIVLLDVMELLSVVGGALLDRPCQRLDAPSICFVCVFVCRKLYSHLGV